MINGSILSTSTITNKSENQDAHDRFRGNKFNDLYIADGLGSYTEAKVAAAKAVANLKPVGEVFKKSKRRGGKKSTSQVKEFEKSFKEAANELKNLAEERKKDLPAGNNDQLYGTTLLTLRETSDKIYFAYVGNGAMWHIRGNFNSFPEIFPYPWNAINYLNPHSIPQDGKEALYRLISDSGYPEECIPTVLAIDKDQKEGDIFMLCSDGIYSADQINCGNNDKGTWVKYPEPMLIFFRHLERYCSDPAALTDDALQVMLEGYLEEIKPHLDDDATLGVLITAEAIKYHKSLVTTYEGN